jgi:hypothetical protein
MIDLRTLELVEKFLAGLSAEAIPYCHWKSTTRIVDSLSGETDLDLLVAAERRDDCQALLERLDFRLAKDPWELDLPGISHYFGFDRPSGSLVHVHLHFQLIVGDDLLKNYRLPVEKVFFASARIVDGIAIPSPEVEFITFVLRMTLKRRLLSVLVRLFFLMGSPLGILRQLAGLEAPLLSRDAQEEFTDLQGKIDEVTLAKTLDEGFPFVPPALFQLCRDSLDEDARRFAWLEAGKRLDRALAGYRRLKGFFAAPGMFRQAFRLRVRAVLARAGCRGLTGKSLATGGRIIGIGGGDGAMRAGLFDDTARWLKRYFAVAGLRLEQSGGETSGKRLRPLRQAIRLRKRGMVVLLDIDHGVERPRHMGVDQSIVLQAGMENPGMAGHREDVVHLVDSSRPLPEIVSRVRTLVWDGLGREKRGERLRR